MGELPKAVIERMLKQKSGLRISSEAVEEVSRLVENFINCVAEEGAILAKHAGRSTLMASDVKLAVRRASEELNKSATR
jgi:histone H3/H4